MVHGKNSRLPFLYRKITNNNEELDLKLTLIQDIKTFTHLQNPKYNNTLELLQVGLPKLLFLLSVELLSLLYL